MLADISQALALVLGRDGQGVGVGLAILFVQVDGVVLQQGLGAALEEKQEGQVGRVGLEGQQFAVRELEVSRVQDGPLPAESGTGCQAGIVEVLEVRDLAHGAEVDGGLVLEAAEPPELLLGGAELQHPQPVLEPPHQQQGSDSLPGAH